METDCDGNEMGVVVRISVITGKSRKLAPYSPHLEAWFVYACTGRTVRVTEWILLYLIFADYNLPLCKTEVK
jgi:hypothetical protein